MTEPEVTAEVSAEETVTISTFRDLTEFVVAEIDSGRMWCGWTGGKFSYGELAQQEAPTEDFVAVDVTDREAVGVLVGAIASHLVALQAQQNAPKPLNREQRRQVQRNAEKRAKELWTPGK